MKSIKHIAVILDGNRRFAKNNKKESYMGHKAGGETLKNFLLWCDELGIKEVTLYAFSMQNFNRSEKEKNTCLSCLMIILQNQLKQKSLKIEK